MNKHLPVSTRYPHGPFLFFHLDSPTCALSSFIEIHHRFFQLSFLYLCYNYHILETATTLTLVNKTSEVHRYRRYIFHAQGSKFYLIFVYHSTETYSSELFYKRMNLAKPYESECEDASAFYYTKLGSLTVLPLDNPKRN